MARESEPAPAGAQVEQAEGAEDERYARIRSVLIGKPTFQGRTIVLPGTAALAREMGTSTQVFYKDQGDNVYSVLEAATGLTAVSNRGIVLFGPGEWGTYTPPGASEGVDMDADRVADLTNLAATLPGDRLAALIGSLAQTLASRRA